MSSKTADTSIYTLFQAVGIVMGVAAFFYTMQGLAGMDFSSMLLDFLTTQAQKVVSSVFEGLFSAI
ncbi:MAG: hypothetical protein GOV01_00580 [Candidatus Altiarchaeota archaeon]|nr:hypothetical protein [Candidatus Altiarchaeota archaeon]